MAKTINEYESLVNFLKEALKFYADEENYNQNINQNNVLVSQIELDSGYQAKFALKQIDVIAKANEDMEEEMLKHFPKEMENTDTQEEFLKIIEQLKNIK